MSEKPNLTEMLLAINDIHNLAMQTGGDYRARMQEIEDMADDILRRSCEEAGDTSFVVTDA